MKRIRKIAPLAILVTAFPAVVAADSTDNDVVLRGDKGEYIEVFKRDSADGDKNYLYTITTFEDDWGRVCTVVTGDSEQTIALDCDRPQG